MQTLDPKFEMRKVDHLRLALSEDNQSFADGAMEHVQLVHEALPDLDFKDVNLSISTIGLSLRVPFLISSMTAGHAQSVELNLRLTRLAAAKGWLMGVGSQRRELFDDSAANEWRSIRKEIPKARWLGNIGIAQLIITPIETIQKLVDSLEPVGLIVHLNSLQEVVQIEGTPQFRGGFKKLTEVAKIISVPIVVKETGCGFSKATLRRIAETGIAAIDVSGRGGTHWGRIEGKRVDKESIHGRAAETFRDWGISTPRSMKNALDARLGCEVWASGGLRNGLDSAKMLAMGARVVGFAKPILEAALQSEGRALELMEQLEFELKIALFCTGAKSLEELRQPERWTWKENTTL